jgi:hypothetical protein
MSHAESSARDSATGYSELSALVLSIPATRRATVLQSAASFRPDRTLEQSFAVGPIRAAFAQYWETRFGQAVPIQELRGVLEPPVHIGTVLEFNKLTLARCRRESLPDHVTCGHLCRTC